MAKNSERKQLLASRLKKARLEAGLTQKQAGEFLSVSDVSYGDYERAKTDIDIPVLEKLAQLFVKPLEWFLLGDVDLPPRPLSAILKEAQDRYMLLDTMEIPIRGTVPAGMPSSEDEMVEGYIPIPKAELGDASKSVYALRVIGECLVEEGISSGDLVIVDPAFDLTDGLIYVVRLGGEGMCRRLYRQDKHIRLVSDSGEYQVRELDEVEILGRVLLSGQWRRH